MLSINQIYTTLQMKCHSQNKQTKKIVMLPCHKIQIIAVTITHDSVQQHCSIELTDLQADHFVIYSYTNRQSGSCINSLFKVIHATIAAQHLKN